MAEKTKTFFGLIKYISKHTKIHGVNFIGNENIHKFERFFWFVVVLAALLFSCHLINSNWNHYNANPTVITLKKDYRNWENPFPTATVCYLNRLDAEKAEEFIKKEWNMSRNNTKFNYYEKFLHLATNLTYDTFHELKPFEYDPTIQHLDLVDLVVRLHPDLSGFLVTFQTKIKTDWEMILTEYGLCFTFNNGFLELLQPKFKSNTNLKLGNDKEQLKCHYLNGLCYARYDSNPQMPMKYHIHSFLDIIHTTASEPSFLVETSEELEVNFRLIETYSSSDIRYLTPKQRKCRFDNEPITKNVPVYSKSICQVECRYRMAMERCGCKPYFYIFFNGKVCDIKGMICLSQFSEFFNQRQTDCNCPQPCDIRVYLKENIHLTRWEVGIFGQRITFRWGLLPPTTKYYRKIIFGFQDLIVSFGGILSLFLGMSFISIIEVVFLIFDYFFLQ